MWDYCGFGSIACARLAAPWLEAKAGDADSAARYPYRLFVNRTVRDIGYLMETFTRFRF